MGNVSSKANEPFLHLHINMSDEACQSYGGHLFSAEILATGEFFIRTTESNIPRKFDENIGLFLWEFGHCEE